MKAITLAAVAAVLIFGSNPSKAIGTTEAGILYGIFGTVILQEVFNKEDGQYYPENPNGDFPPFRCSGDSVTCSYQRGKWERERIEWQKAKDQAYNCGRYPEKCSSS
jgi:hypothetical protein